MTDPLNYGSRASSARRRPTLTSQLESAGLDASVAQVPSTDPAGTVVAQHPAGGKARRGSAVRLNVSRGA